MPAPPCTDEQHIQTKVAVLFSGGLDCTVVARLCHDLLPPDQAIDLINVAFENPRVAANARKAKDQETLESFDIYEACPDRVTGRKSFAELQAICPGRAWRFTAVSLPLSIPSFISHIVGRSMFHILNTSTTRAKSHRSYTPTTPRWIFLSPAPCTLLHEDKAPLSPTPRHTPLRLTLPAHESCSQDSAPMSSLEVTSAMRRLSKGKATLACSTSSSLMSVDWANATWAGTTGPCRTGGAKFGSLFWTRSWSDGPSVLQSGRNATLGNRTETSSLGSGSCGFWRWSWAWLE